MKPDEIDPCVYIYHIQDECAFILETVSGITRDDFFESRLIQGSMRNSIMIIGEAVSNLPKEFTAEHPEIAWQKIKDTRNRYIHGYFSIDPMRVWILLTKDIPPLKEQIEELLRTLSTKHRS